MKRRPIRERISKRFRRVASKHRVSNSELQKVWKSQFEFAKSKLEGYTHEYLANASVEELKEIVINFMYLGKIHSAESLQKFGNKKNEENGSIE